MFRVPSYVWVYTAPHTNQDAGTGARARGPPGLEPVLEVERLVKAFPHREGGRVERLWAVNDISFTVAQGEILGLVGESGCGKSTVARCIVKLHQVTGGRILFRGIDIAPLGAREFRPYRRRINMVFQDPTDSLNPRLTVKSTVVEPLDLHTRLPRKEKDERVLALLRFVGLNREHLDRYPHQLSTGQRQRVGIARAVISSPELVVLDEPTAALDVSVRGRILELLLSLRQKLDATYVVISHDLGVIRHVCDRTAVMYLGGLVEVGRSVDLLDAPGHPYTRALVAAIPRTSAGAGRPRPLLRGEVPSPINLPPGCSFQARCPEATEQCLRERPVLGQVGPGRLVACHRVRG